MDAIRLFLYNKRIMLDGFRRVYHESTAPARSPFRLHVQGYCVVRDHIVDVPRGTSCWFLHHFHDAVRMRTDRGDRITVPPHTFSIDAPGAPIYHGSSGSWRHSWLRVSGWRMDALVASSGLQPATPYPLPGEGDSLRWLEAVDHLMNHPQGADEESARHVLELWLRRIRFFHTRGRHPPIPESLLKARRHIEARYLHRLRLEEIARVACLSRSQLCRQFRRYMGISPLEYAIRCRLHHARELLLTTNLPVGDVARQSGFRDIYYFSRLYKQRHEHSPQGERKRGN